MIWKTDGGQVTNYIYNVENRLISVEDSTGSVIAEYYYDPLGRRLWKDVGGIRTYFLYSDEGLVGEYDSSGFEIKTYGYQPGSYWGTDPLFMKEGDNYYFYHNHHEYLGTPQKITAINGAVVWEAKYTSFGQAIIEPSSTVTNNLRFPGQYFDSETGLHYNRNRYYNPEIGRYLRADPFNEGVNFYAYCANNPLIFIDPLGLRYAPQVFERTIKVYEIYIFTLYECVDPAETCKEPCPKIGKPFWKPEDPTEVRKLAWTIKERKTEKWDKPWWCWVCEILGNAPCCKEKLYVTIEIISIEENPNNMPYWSKPSECTCKTLGAQRIEETSTHRFIEEATEWKPYLPF